MAVSSEMVQMEALDAGFVVDRRIFPDEKLDSGDVPAADSAVDMTSVSVDSPEKVPRATACGPRVVPGPTASEMVIGKNIVEGALRRYCGECHGCQILDPVDAEGGINFIDSVDPMVEAGLFIYGDSEISPAIVLMRDSQMPPPAGAGPFPTGTEIDEIAAFFDSPLY